MKSSRRSLRNHTGALTNVLTVLLVVIYAMGTSHLELLHSWIYDHHHSVSHSDVQEDDPCHRMIYHHDLEEGCDHDAHLAASDQCDFCDMTLQRDHIAMDQVMLSKARFYTINFLTYKESLSTYWAVISSSRAPPVVA